MSVLLTSRVVGTCASGNCAVLAGGGAGVGADAGSRSSNTALYGTLALVALGVAVVAGFAKKSLDEEHSEIEAERSRFGARMPAVTRY